MLQSSVQSYQRTLDCCKTDFPILERNYKLWFALLGECWSRLCWDWAGDLNDLKSTSGYTFQMSGATVSWRSKKQTCVALSTSEAEYIALSAATREALWMRQLLTNLSVNVEKPITIYEGNQSWAI